MNFAKRLTLAAVASCALSGMALAQAGDRLPTDDEMIRVEEALTKDGYTMVDDIHVDDDQYTAIAKGRDDKDVRVTLDPDSLAVLKVEPLPLTLP